MGHVDGPQAASTARGQVKQVGSFPRTDLEQAPRGVYHSVEDVALFGGDVGMRRQPLKALGLGFIGIRRRRRQASRRRADNSKPATI